MLWTSRETLPLSMQLASRGLCNIGGNKYRLVVVVQFSHQCVYVRFVGTHKEYDKVDCLTI